MKTYILDQLPAPPDLPGSEASRGRHQRNRELLLGGNWKKLLVSELQERLGTTRAAAVAKPDMSSNIMRTVATQLAVLYDRIPALSADGDEEGAVKALMGAGGYWQVMSYVQRMVIGMNEGLVAIRPGAGGVPIYRYASPGYVVAEARADSPDIPVRLKELRLKRKPEDQGLEWVWECWDADPKSPSFHVETIDGDDITARYATDMDGQPVGARVGDAYPYRKQDGTPVLPYVLYHAQRTPRLFDAFEGVELYEGSLAAACGWSNWYHCHQDASWPQRYTLGCAPAGAAGIEGNRHAVVSDPTTIMQLEQTDENATIATVGQWEAGSDPSMLADDLTKYEARLASAFGISPSDILRVGGAAARSGYAIALTQAGKRAAQQKMIPHYRRGDIAAASKTAAIINSAFGTTLTESGFSIKYQPVPKTAAERDADRRHVRELMQDGLMDKVDALVYLNHGLSREEARRRLARIRTNNIV